MQVILDQQLDQPNATSVKYAGFWVRFGALIIDGIVLAPITVGVLWFNITSWKSIPVLLAATLINMAYKPYMEYAFGATLGKMALRLKVVNLNFDKAELGTILLRNIFNIIPAVFGLIFSIQMYGDAEFASIEGYQEFMMFSQQYGSQNIVNGLSGLLTIAEAIMIGVDEQKRSLHDRIAGTYVIEKP